MHPPTHPSDKKDLPSAAADTVAPDPLERSKPRFSLNPIAFALVGLACAGRVYVGLYEMKHDQGMLWVTDMMAGITGTILFSIGPAWLMWKITRGRRSLATATCIVMLSLINFAYLNSLNVADRQANDKALEKFDSVVSDHSEQQADIIDRALSGEDVMSEAVDLFGQNISDFEAIGRESTGQQAQVFAAATKVMRRLEEPLKAYLASSKRFNDAGGINAATMLDRETIPDRLQMIDEFAEANERLATTYASLHPEMRRELELLNFNEEFVDEFLKGWWETARPDIVSKLRQTDRDLIVNFRGLINTLDAAHGQWSISAEGLVFNSDAIRDQYNSYFKQMYDAAARQNSLQQQLQQAATETKASP